MIDSSAVKAHRSAAGAKKGVAGDASGQAIGRSRGGRTMKIHALCDQDGRPHAVLPTGGNVDDITAATLLSVVAPPGALIGDKGYDANHLREFLAERGTAAVIPSTTSRKVPIPHDPERYKLRNVIERTFGRLKNFRGRCPSLSRPRIDAFPIPALPRKPRRDRNATRTGTTRCASTRPGCRQPSGWRFGCLIGCRQDAPIRNGLTPNAPASLLAGVRKGSSVLLCGCLPVP